jgi:hypothetical protein
VSREHDVITPLETTSKAAKYGDTFDWQSRGPIEFIDLLKERDGYTVRGVHRGWLKPVDIPPLVDLLDSQEPCGDVKMSISSYYHAGLSTVGREAAFLIQGFRKGEYPPGLNSIHFEYEIEEILNWWNNYDSKPAT